MTEESPKGQLYSHFYLERTKPLPDSARARVRMAQYVHERLTSASSGTYGPNFGAAIRRELGAPLKWENGAYQVWSFLLECTPADFLSTLTLIYKECTEKGWNRPARFFKEFVERMLREENLAYRVDDGCGIHPLVDLEFERNAAATIAGLSTPRYSAARAAFQSAQSKLEDRPPDTKGAIRDTFEAAETLTKLITSSGKALDAGFVRADLLPRLDRHYETNTVGKRATAKMAQSFADWIDAAHVYRHGHEAEQPVSPPEELAILIVSQGAGFLRWLVDLDLLLTGGGLV